MLHINRLLFSLAVLTSAVSGATINHDAVVGFPQAVPSTAAGTLYLKYKPYLEVFNGCVPFPAVDAAGNTGGGLAPNGSPKGGCSSSIGQVYARGKGYGGLFAVMYSWYMPKDSPSDGLGHRHDWENVIIWLSGESESASVVGMAVSQHGGYDKSSSGTFSGNSPLVGYISYWPVNHQMIFTEKRGGQQPLIAWESLTGAARAALENTDFGDASVPFKDSYFDTKLAAAVL
ncbi:Fc.00g015890.m01.CDS01 [Cosmosporella sp. VM-42]